MKLENGKPTRAKWNRITSRRPGVRRFVERWSRGEALYEDSGEADA